jgi:hypothetical protein
LDIAFARLLKGLDKPQPEESVRSTRAMIQESLCVVPISLTILDQLEDLLDRAHLDFIRTFDNELLVFSFMDGEDLLSDSFLVVLKKVIDRLVIDFNIR